MKIFKRTAFYIIILGVALFWYNTGKSGLYYPKKAGLKNKACISKMSHLRDEIASYQKKHGFAAGEFDIKNLEDHYEIEFACPFSVPGSSYNYTAKCCSIDANGSHEVNIEISCENHGYLNGQNDRYDDSIDGPKLKGYQKLLKTLYDLNAAGIMILLGFIWLIVDLRGYFSTHSCPSCGLVFYELNAFEIHLKQCRSQDNGTLSPVPGPARKSAFHFDPAARGGTGDNKAVEIAICPAKRMAAFLIDTFLIFFLSCIMNFLMFLILRARHETPGMTLAIPAPVFILYMIKDLYNCHSPGKMLIGLDISDLKGFPAAFKNLILRNISFALAFAIFFACFFASSTAFNKDILIFIGLLIIIIELLSMLSNKPGRRFGDFLARTRVNDMNPGSTGWVYLFVSIVLIIMFAGLLELIIPDF
ncbi:MAG TPA: RDD family protein [Candidatus Wallbacteria bacterium]|nr:MAG: RDD family protein [bacterium ADurb.Bin243]HPG57881.1 RDD family protein [Candidatus Wallbacteria bacterium]